MWFPLRRVLIGEMNLLDDAELLRRFASTHSEDDFAELVRRHLNLVYSASLRQMAGDHQNAEEVTQTVFADLARKAGLLTSHSSLAGWLYTSAHFAAAKMVRGEQRRRLREQKAHQMHETHANSTPELDWERLQPVIDGAMHELPEADREVILQRYFERKPFLQIGARLGLTENAARMRAERALDKLRGILATRGVSSTTVALAAVLMAQAVLAAPTALAGAVVAPSLAAAAAKTAVAGGGLITAAKLKVLIPSTCAVALFVAMTVQHQAMNRLRDENAGLRRRQQLTAVAESSAAAINQPEATGDQQGEKLELLRLRGEVGRIRRELAEQQTLAARLAETNSIAVQVAPKIDPQINVRAQFFTGTDEALEFFPDNSTGVVAPLELGKILKRLKESDKVKMLAEQQVTTLSGRQAQVTTSQARTNLSTGVVTESGHTVDVLPTLREDGGGVVLDLVVTKIADKPVVPDEVKEVPLPSFGLSQMTANTVVLDGQTVAMAQRSDGKKLVVFVTTTLIDPAGNPIHPKTEP